MKIALIFLFLMKGDNIFLYEDGYRSLLLHCHYEIDKHHSYLSAVIYACVK
jgi:hypothetical protein